VSARDVSLLVRLSADKIASGGNMYAYLQFRRVDNNNYCLGRIRFATGGQAFLEVDAISAGVTTHLGTEVQIPGFTQGANEQLWFRVQAIGANPTTLSTKAWPVGQSEPGGWQYSVTDSTTSLQASGVIAI
jgi:hypothetical protein